MNRLRITFESLKEDKQEKIFNLLVEKYTIQGKNTPNKRAWEKIKENKLQTRKAWQRLVFFTMQGIDKALKEKGLPPKHFTSL